MTGAVDVVDADVDPLVSLKQVVQPVVGVDFSRDK